MQQSEIKTIMENDTVIVTMTEKENEIKMKEDTISQDDKTFKSIDIDDINLTSFLSNISFLDVLTSINERMKDIEKDLQMSWLRTEIDKVNRQLPSNTYIPFLKSSIRNYVVCHIPITELRIFRTKSRAPFLLTIEVIRIDELIQ
jgi:hypothetical protein